MTNPLNNPTGNVIKMLGFNNPLQGQETRKKKEKNVNTFNLTQFTSKINPLAKKTGGKRKNKTRKPTRKSRGKKH